MYDFDHWYDRGVLLSRLLKKTPEQEALLTRNTRAISFASVNKSIPKYRALSSLQKTNDETQQLKFEKALLKM